MISVSGMAVKDVIYLERIFLLYVWNNLSLLFNNDSGSLNLLINIFNDV